MPRNPKLPELDVRDRLIIVELLRFGFLASEHLARRCGLSSAAEPHRLRRLCTKGFVKKNWRWFQPTHFYVATARGVEAARADMQPIKPDPKLVRHHLAVADLADLLMDRDPTAGWRTERELQIDRQQESAYDWGRRNAHRPDGLLLQNDRRIAIELEISRKSSDEYAEICGWYAEQVEVDELHWYVDSPGLQRYIERVVRRNGLGIDLGVFVFPFPRGVRVRQWA